MKRIVQKDDPVLRQVASPVPVEAISSEKVQTLIRDMKAALDTQKDGVALAAPQIGESLRIFVVSPKAYDDETDTNQEANQKNTKFVFINPEIIKQSKKKTWMNEGCLSVRPLEGKAHRHEKTTVRAYDEVGNRFTYGGSDLLSQIFQHETDHLNGILFIDHAKDVQESKKDDPQNVHAEKTT